jgi:hypothetical protein
MSETCVKFEKMGRYNGEKSPIISFAHKKENTLLLS